MSQREEIDLFWQYTVRAIDGIIACLDQAPAEEWNWKPVETANSLFVLATHVLGSTEWLVQEVLYGEPVGRTATPSLPPPAWTPRPSAPNGRSPARLQQKLDQLPAGALDAECIHPRQGTMTGQRYPAHHELPHPGRAPAAMRLRSIC